MKLFHKKPQPAGLTRTEALDGIPQPAPTVTWKLLENGDILIEYPLQLKPFFIELFNRFQDKNTQNFTRKLQLDSMGSIVWQMINGENTTKEIIKAVSSRSGLSLQESEISVTGFIRELGRRGLVLIR